MRGLFVLFWAGMIFVFTCTASFNGLMDTGEIRFYINPTPHFSELLAPLPLQLSGGFLIQKFGHAFAFFILTALLQIAFQSKKLVFSLATFYAALTEFLQLFFTRDGRLFDVGIDTIGILLALGIGRLFMTHPSRETNF
ncbi:VanZ family protein [Neobacillus kokaensis]|uniref:Membrane protein YwnJ n=1 Tax=Neobacillus kokaensis TaxID=2759023 RepID=A0ABQ3MZZ7_9BACI|nr:VanZ family protein [Neobacillus kokaensis]GHH97399.1 putative membrane protein YwnJ [Neobacillus kokaensis]